MADLDGEMSAEQVSTSEPEQTFVGVDAAAERIAALDAKISDLLSMPPGERSHVNLVREGRTIT